MDDEGELIETTRARSKGGRRRFLATVGLFALLVLFLPEPDPTVQAAGEQPFVWNQDEVWDALQARFDERLQSGCAGVAESVGALDERVSNFPSTPNAAQFDALETDLFETAADVAACPEHANALVTTYGRLRERLKDASREWNPADRVARTRLYRVLYGGRMAIEEVLLQMRPAEMPVLVRGRDEPSASPSTMVHDVRVHSGDILVSRGGAPTSALIARGNDYPGNFSHVALVYVDDEGHFETIESHIEVGAVVAGLERYEEDGKLRVMLLRPRAELKPGAFGNAAAEHARERVMSGHVPYDFEMNFDDDAAMFCSEVAYDAYDSQDIFLWRGLTTTSSEGTARWLSRFGVRRFETLGPSDLEYDPQLVVVAEWRDPETLFDDHVDATVIDGLLLSADAGEDVGFTWYRLPLARILKAYSWIKNLFGGVGPIPEGMSAQAALRIEWLRERHAAVRERVLEGARAYEGEHGHRAPYWELFRLARDAARVAQ